MQGLVWDHAGPNSFTYAYDPVTDALTSQVNANPLLTFAPVASRVSCPVHAWDTLQITLMGQNKDVFDIEDFTINGTSYGTLEGDFMWEHWHIKGLDLSEGFTVEGDIVFKTHPRNNGDGNYVQIEVGCSK
jgi:hypothetical protein